ncbi:MAG TPA: alpha/beta hydrolase [Arenicellales bacterium]|nr:alpha/beta hydrolase [Arenicellales bacterium]
MEELKTLELTGGLRLEYRIHRCSRGANGLIVLLHGLASNLTRWSELVEQTSLAQGWDLLRLNLRGHGYPPWRGRLDMETWCADLARLLDAEGRERAFFIGHSLGAQIAVWFAHRQPRRTAGLVLIDPVLGGALLGQLSLVRRFAFLLKGVAGLVCLLNRLGIHRRNIPSRDLRALDEAMRRELLSEGRIEEMVKRYSSPLPDFRHFPSASLLQEVIEMVRPLPDLSSVTVPVLVVQSRGATYTDPAAARRSIERMPDADTVVIDAYHWPLTEKPDETRRAIESWFDKQAPAPE